MKALRLYGINQLIYDEVPYPKHREDEVVIKVKAAGICGSDIPRVFEKGTYHFPTTIGHEFAGEIVEAAESGLIGKGAAVIPLLPCHNCQDCQAGNYAQCQSYNYYGSRCDGGMSEYIAVKKDNLVMLPEGVSYLEGAMCEPTAVALHTLKKAGIKQGNIVVIWGIGPIGLILAQWARLIGAKDVILVARSDDKVAFAKKMGFSNAINATTRDEFEYIQAITNGQGADICVEGTGTAEALECCLLNTTNFGKVVALGNPLGQMVLSQKAYWNILRREIQIIGVWNSKFHAQENDWKDTLAAFQMKKIDVLPLITHKFLLKDYQSAFDIMHKKKELYCKIMFISERNEVKW